MYNKEASNNKEIFDKYFLISQCSLSCWVMRERRGGSGCSKTWRDSVRSVYSCLLLRLAGLRCYQDAIAHKYFWQFLDKHFCYLIQRSHGGGGRGDHIVDKEEQGILWSQADPLPDEKVELANGEIWRNKVLLLVKVSDTSLGTLLHNHRNSVRILPPNLLSLSSPLLEGVFFFVLPLHDCCLAVDISTVFWDISVMTDTGYTSHSWDWANVTAQ